MTMREILFRGKRNDTGEWIFGSIVHQTDYYGDKCDRWFILEGNYTNDYDIDYPIEVLKETVGQFTGLLDKNGTKIFEGDVLDMSIIGPDHSLNAVSIEHGAVGFFPLYPEEEAEEDRRWRSFWKDDEQEFWSDEYFTVIGNIYDNPELLEVSDNG